MQIYAIYGVVVDGKLTRQEVRPVVWMNAQGIPHVIAADERTIVPTHQVPNFRSLTTQHPGTGKSLKESLDG